ncbi:hypothetical protein G4Y79_00185 [Phototrophicus methaneseepsis]|uniref:Uncharacterized protein n=1 Tax=Phototrophicus methaneseepsis TaxID=2710758 RepID=A0A7S8IEU9_9CHLR|nr:hypothetical protein [Phototrophicus methaneseepsis]QPC82829.1 hypothetical protein G4Y79_00185 [Phototrophicus methaneseepsis]
MTEPAPTPRHRSLSLYGDGYEGIYRWLWRLAAGCVALLVLGCVGYSLMILLQTLLSSGI